MFEAFSKVFDSRQKISAENWKQSIGEMFADTGDTRDPCTFVNDRKLGLLLRIFSDRRKKHVDQVEDLAKALHDKLVESKRKEWLDASDKRLEEIDEELDQAAREARKLFALLDDKVAQLLELGVDAEEAIYAMQLYVKKARLGENVLFPVICTSLTRYYESQSELKKLEDQVTKLEGELQEVMHAANNVQLPQQTEKQKKSTVDASAVSQSCSDFTLSDVLSAASKACLSEKTVMAKLCTLEEECCAGFGVTTFSELQKGSFVAFLEDHKDEISDVTTDDTHGEVKRFLASLFAEEQAEKEDDNSLGLRPSPSVLMQEILKYLHERGRFITSWTILRDIEEAVPKRIGPEKTWVDVCGLSFVTFMLKNVSTFQREGYSFIASRPTSSGEAQPCKELVASFISSALNANKNWLEHTAEEALGKVDEMLDTSSFTEALRKQFNVKSVDDFGYGTAKDILRQADGELTKAAKDTFVFPEIVFNVDNEVSTSRVQESEAKSILGKDPLETMKSACREPQGPNGVELSSLLLWKQVYENEHGALDAFLSKNIRALQQMHARILFSSDDCKARPKCYLINTFADISSIEAAAESRDYFKLGVQLWSLIYSKPKGPDSLSYQEVDRIKQTLTDAFNAAREDRLLPLAATEILISIPTSVVKGVFGDFVEPILHSVERLWLEIASKTVQKHPQKDALLVRACLLGYSKWVNDATTSLQESPEYPKKSDGSSSHYQMGRVAAIQNVGKEKEETPDNSKPSGESVPVAVGKEENQPAHEKENRDQADDDASSPERQLLQEIRKDLNCGADDNVTRMLRKTLDVLSTQLYESRFHFFFELIQNADDNSYVGNTRPSLCITLSDDGIEVLNNEAGFTADNVRAVCGVNMSTKTAREAIGRKGIGFKAVFSVSDRPHIVSNGFNFYFDKESCDIGLILPIPGQPVSPSTGILVDAKTLCDGKEADGLKDNEWVTRLSLPFREDLLHDRFHSECSREIGDIESLVLLFLNQLKRITVVDRVRGLTRTLLREDNQCSEEETQEVSLIQIEDGIELSRDTYFVSKSRFCFPESLSHYKGTLPLGGVTTIQAGFLKTEKLPQDAFPVMGYLPTGTRLFKFILQADWNLNAARDRIVESDEWNNWLKKVAVQHLVESLDLLKEHIAAGYLPKDYILAILPERQLDRTAWFRSFVKDLFMALREELCIPTEAGDFITPKAAVVVQDDLREVVLELFPDDILASVKSKRYAHATVSHHEAVAVALGVTELTPGLWVDLMEKFISANSIDLSLSWLAKYFLTYDTLLQRSCLTDQQQVNLHGRLSKLPILPVTGEKRLCAEGSSILYMPKMESSAESASYLFFDRLKIIDQAFFDQITENTKLYIVLRKLGVHPAHATDVLQSMFQHVLKEWDDSGSKAPGRKATKEDADILVSCLVWLTDGNRRFRIDGEKSILEEAYDILPLVCQVSKGLATSDFSLTQNVIPIEGSDKVLARPRRVHVMLGDPPEYRICKQSLGWLVVDPVYFSRSKNTQLLGSTLKDCLSVRHGLFGYYEHTNIVEGTDGNWVALQEAERDEVRQFCHNFDVQKVVPDSLYKELPSAQDGKFTLQSDKRLLGIERMVNYLSGASINKENKNDLARISGLIVNELTKNGDLRADLCTRVSYLPQFEGELFAGRVATHHDTRHSDDHPGTTLVILREKAWLLGSDGLLHRPREVFADNEKVHLIFDDTVVRASQFGKSVDNVNTLALFGLVQEPQDHHVIRAVRKWQAAGSLTTTPNLMVAILKRLRSNMKRLWVPDVRGKVKHDSKLCGKWYSPEDCFAKGGKDAFLDEAPVSTRFIGYTYMYCGRELADCGVKEHAPWELQVKCMSLLTEKKKSPENFHDLLKQFDLFQGEVPPEAFDALKKAKIWLTRDSKYVCPADSAVLYADRPLPRTIRKLPGKYELLEYSYSDAFMSACSIRKFSEVVEESRTVTPWKQPSFIHLSLKCLWKIVFDVLQKAAVDVLDEDELTATVGRATELEALSEVRDCDFVEGLTLSLSINGTELPKTGGSSGDTGVFVDSTRKRMYIVMEAREVSSAVELVEAWITEHLLHLSSNLSFRRTAKMSLQPLNELCETAVGWRSMFVGIQKQLKRHEAEMCSFSQRPWLTCVKKLTDEDIAVRFDIPPQVEVASKGQLFGWAAWIVAKEIFLHEVVTSCPGSDFWVKTAEEVVDRIEEEGALVAVAGKIELHFSLHGAEISSGDATPVCIRERDQQISADMVPTVQLLFEVPSVPADVCTLAADMVREVSDYLVSLAWKEEFELEQAEQQEYRAGLLDRTNAAATRVRLLGDEFPLSFPSLTDAFVSLSTFAAQAISDSCLSSIDVIPQRYKEPYEEESRNIQKKKDAAKAARQERTAETGVPSGPVVAWGGKQVTSQGSPGNGGVLAAATAAKSVWASNEAPQREGANETSLDFIPSAYEGVREGYEYATGSKGVGYYNLNSGAGKDVSRSHFVEAPYVGDKPGYEYGEGTKGKGYYKQKRPKELQLFNNPALLAKIMSEKHTYLQQRVANGDTFIRTIFVGDCDGYTFQTGKEGTGYYKDLAHIAENDSTSVTSDKKEADENKGEDDEEDDVSRTPGRRRHDERLSDASDDEEELILLPAAPESTAEPKAESATTVNDSCKAPADQPPSRVPQSILASLKTKFTAPGQPVSTVSRQTKNLLFSETGKQGEYAAAEFLRQQKDRFPDGVLWMNEHNESFLPFDLVAGVSADVFEDLRVSRISYEDIIKKHPSFVAIEVKSTVHSTDSTAMHLSLSELKAAEVLRKQYIIVLVSTETGKVQEYADPCSLIRANYLSLVLLPPKASD
ncbi:hypothetical protein DIPPA_22370 [Diplonema papillatum]|nr:hypothetical protein DIPPA_22370 [Diplonema papillatum]